MARNRMILLVSSLGTCLVAGCGGGGVNSAPPLAGPAQAAAPAPAPAPTPAAAPAPSPSATSPLPPPTIGLTEGQPYTALAVSADYVHKDDLSWAPAISPPRPVSVEIRYLADEGLYEIDLPDIAPGVLGNIGYSGSVGQIAEAVGGTLVDASGNPLGIHVEMRATGHPDYIYSYSHFGHWSGAGGEVNGQPTSREGYFVYGSPAASVPLTGTATYSANLVGTYFGPEQGFPVTGDVKMQFDFAAGTLTGFMHPKTDTNGFYPSLDFDFGRYEFVDTQFLRGQPAFSGRFALPDGLTGSSWFEGLLTGPNAEEVIATWAAPFVAGQQGGMMSGIWIGARD